jgi:hypothetical protein
MHTLSSHLSPCSIAMRPCTTSADPTHQPTLAPPSPSTRQGMQYVPLFQKVLNPSLATPGRTHQASPSPTTLLPTPSKSSFLRATGEELHHVPQRCSPSKEPERRENMEEYAFRPPSPSFQSPFHSLLEHLHYNSIPLSPHVRLVTGAAGGSLRSSPTDPWPISIKRVACPVGPTSWVP